MRRKALVVGIDGYKHFGSLNYAEKDAAAIAQRLKFDADDESQPNFDVRVMLGKHEPITRARLRQAMASLFADSAGLDLAFYFAGHGYISDTGGHLVTAEGEMNDYGITMEELTSAARTSRASSVLLMLDCCNAGAVGDLPFPHATGQHALLRDNMTIIAASLPMQQASESAEEGGLFTAALRDALDGAAADVLGEITIASIFALVERRFSLWQQQPVAKSYVTRPIVLRRVKARLSRQELRRIVDLFPTRDHAYGLQPDHDPERDLHGLARTPEVQEMVEIGRLFKRYRDAALLRASIYGEDLYYTAQRSHTVELTPFGKEYWRLVKLGRA